MISYEFQWWMLTLNQFILSIDYKTLLVFKPFLFFNLFSLQTKPPSLFSCYKNWLDTLCGIDPNFYYCILLEKFRFYFWVSTTALQIGDVFGSRNLIHGHGVAYLGGPTPHARNYAAWKTPIQVILRFYFVFFKYFWLQL